MQEYVPGEVHTQEIKNFWSSLKRGLNGTYVAVKADTASSKRPVSFSRSPNSVSALPRLFCVLAQSSGTRSGVNSF